MSWRPAPVGGGLVDSLSSQLGPDARPCERSLAGLFDLPVAWAPRFAAGAEQVLSGLRPRSMVLLPLVATALLARNAGMPLEELLHIARFTWEPLVDRKR